VELTAVLAAIAVAAQRASALPAGLMAKTTKAVLAASSGKELASIVSASVVELVQGATTALIGSKTKIATVLLLAASLLTGAGAWAWRTLAVPQLAHGERAQSPDAATKKLQTPRENKDKDVTVSGCVVDPDGKSVSGAKLVFVYSPAKKYPQKVWAVSTAEGRFAFTVPVKNVDNGYSEKPWEHTYVVAAAEGYGFAAARLGQPGASDLTLRLVKDDLPLRGRLLDLEGNPVAGARVRLADVLNVPKKGDLTDWLAALKANKDNPGTIDANYLTWLYSPAFDLLFPPVTTGADGRFEMKGIGRERVAHLRIEGPTIATQQIRVMTRASEDFRFPTQKEYPKGHSVAYLGTGFELLAAPSRPVVGIVRDKDTGKPLAGVTIESRVIGNAFMIGFLRTTTDKDGCYRLLGMAKGDGNAIAATTNDLPYLPADKKVENPLGLEPVTVDFALKRGVWVKGRITDKNTGKALGASINYFCFDDNPGANEITNLGNVDEWRSSLEDGSFRMPVLPGHGLIAVRAYHDHYVLGTGADKIKGPRAEGLIDTFRTAPYLCFAPSFHTLVEIDPKPGEESITCEVTLDPGRTLKGTVLGPDGKPLAGARISGLKDMGFWQENSAPDFTVESLKPTKPRLLQFLHEGQKLSGYLVVRGDERDILRVQLKPWGTLTGRVVTPAGNPLTSVRVNCGAELKQAGQAIHSAGITVYPGKDGRFRIEGLVAGLKYEVSISRSNVLETISGGNPKDLTVEPGETKDVGSLTVQPME
jgi:protocatechuate 3,4-dioxygenase beta subunit